MSEATSIQNYAFHIGNSISNNGWAGDSGHSLYDSEAHMYNNGLYVYRNDIGGSGLAGSLGNLQSLTERLKGPRGAAGVLLGSDAEALKSQVSMLQILVEPACKGDTEARGRLYSLAHDMRGLAGTFGHPMVGRFADFGGEFKFDPDDPTDATLDRDGDGAGAERPRCRRAPYA